MVKLESYSDTQLAAGIVVKKQVKDKILNKRRKVAFEHIEHAESRASFLNC